MTFRELVGVVREKMPNAHFSVGVECDAFASGELQLSWRIYRSDVESGFFSGTTPEAVLVAAFPADECLNAVDADRVGAPESPVVIEPPPIIRDDPF